MRAANILQDRRGLSLVEVVVALAILGILVALTSSAVQMVRRSASRLTCQNNLRQQGLALHQFHNSQGHYPAGVRFQDGKDPFLYMSWMTQLLPYLEQGALWEQTVRAYKANRNFLRIPPHSGLAFPQAIFSCPDDGRTSSAQQLGVGQVRALTSYLGVEGANSFRQDGVLFVDSAVKMSAITDGTSHTLLVGERPASADLKLGWWYGGSGQDRDGEGDSVLGTRTRNMTTYGPGCPVGPYDYGPGRLTNQCDAFHFWSLHSGGANFLFVDGSVRFLPYSAAPLLHALATRAGGESVSPPD